VVDHTYLMVPYEDVSLSTVVQRRGLSCLPASMYDRFAARMYFVVWLDRYTVDRCSTATTPTCCAAGTKNRFLIIIRLRTPKTLSEQTSHAASGYGNSRCHGGCVGPHILHRFY